MVRARWLMLVVVVVVVRGSGGGVDAVRKKEDYSGE